MYDFQPVVKESCIVDTLNAVSEFYLDLCFSHVTCMYVRCIIWRQIKIVCTKWFSIKISWLFFLLRWCISDVKEGCKIMGALKQCFYKWYWLVDKSYKYPRILHILLLLFMYMSNHFTLLPQIGSSRALYHVTSYI